MLTGAGLLPPALAGAAAAMRLPDEPTKWFTLLGVWLLLGAASSLLLTPSARLLRRAADEHEHPAVFAAQFSLSHACYMLTYPLAGILGAWVGLPQNRIGAGRGGGDGCGTGPDRLAAADPGAAPRRPATLTPRAQPVGGPDDNSDRPEHSVSSWGNLSRTSPPALRKPQTSDPKHSQRSGAQDMSEQLPNQSPLHRVPAFRWRPDGTPCGLP